MHSPDRSDLVLGLILMIPGIIAAVFVDGFPVQVLVDPRIVADSIVGALTVVSVWLSEDAEGSSSGILFVGLVLASLLYYIGAAAVIMSVVSIVRSSK